MARKAITKGAVLESAPGKTPPRVKVAKSAMIRASIPPELKTEAESILSQLGLSPSDAIRMFYEQLTLCQGLPFEPRIPNAATRKVLRDAEAGRNLTRYADADDLFRTLGVKRGQG
jgi:DNA-damage-inducible protein J